MKKGVTEEKMGKGKKISKKASDDPGSKPVVYIISDLGNPYRNKVNGILKANFTVFQSTDIWSARRDLMDGLMEIVPVVLYASEIEEVNVVLEIENLCRAKNVRCLVLSDVLCDLIIANPLSILS